MNRLNDPNEVVSLYCRAGLARYLEDGWFDHCAAVLRERLEARGVPVSVLFA